MVDSESDDKFTNAPVLIVAYLTMKNIIRYKDATSQKRERELAVQILDAALQSILLIAYAKGLGAC